MPAPWMSLALGLAMQVGQPGPSETPNYPALRNSNNHYGFEGQYEQRYPYDTQQNWVHGYFQEIPAYGGHNFYRPYNYKDVLSQSQTAAGWGASPTMPYAQQFWHRYHDQAVMLKLSQQAPASSLPMAAGHPAGTFHPGFTTALPPANAINYGSPQSPVIPAGNWSAPQGMPQGAMAYPAPVGATTFPSMTVPQQQTIMIPPGYQLVPAAPVMTPQGIVVPGNTIPSVPITSGPLLTP